MEEQFEPTQEKKNLQTIVYHALSGDTEEHNPWFKYVSLVICLALLVSVGFRIFYTVYSENDYFWTPYFIAVYFSFIIFLVEYLLRYWSAPVKDTHIADRDDARYRKLYLKSFLGIVDFIAVASLAFTLFFMKDDLWPSYIIVISLFKLGRYVPGLELVATVVSNERKSLTATVFTLGILVIIMATATFLCEKAAQPEIFKSVPHTMWWGIVTMTTVGYGDMAPVTLLGRFCGAVSALIGVGMLAMPAGIISNGFTEERKRREILLAWKVISNLSFFHGLTTSCIAEIAGVLKTQILPSNAEVFRKGDPADSMYFIAEGNVEVVLHPKSVRLSTGSFFGEGGLVDNKPRNATIRTVTQTRFLVLALHDFYRVATNHPDLNQKIKDMHLTRK
jgi:voltage-gated potassium channel